MYAAKAKCREYVQSVIDDPRTAYTTADMKTVNAFPGHNHYVRCTVSYDTPATEHTKRYACIETLDVYFLPENADRNHTIFMRHITPACSRKVLTGPRPG